MARFNELMKKTLGRVRQETAKFRGVKFEYILHTDPDGNAATKSTITVFGIPTPTDFDVLKEFGVSPEKTVDSFKFSREAFKIGTTFNEPTYLDTFRLSVDGVAQGPVFEIEIIRSDKYDASFEIVAVTIRRKRAAR